jgi:hypothetical protein
MAESAEKTTSKKGAAPAVPVPVPLPVSVQEDVREETEEVVVPSIHIIEASPEVAEQVVPDDNNNKDDVTKQNNVKDGEVFSTPPASTSEGATGPSLETGDKAERKVTFSASSPEIIKSPQSVSGGSSPREGAATDEASNEDGSSKAPAWGDEMATAEVLY